MKKIIKILHIINIILLIIMVVFGILNVIFDSEILDRCTDGSILLVGAFSLTESYLRSKEEKMRKYIEDMNKQNNLDVFDEFNEKGKETPEDVANQSQKDK